MSLDLYLEVDKKMNKANKAFAIYPKNVANSLEEYFRNVVVYNPHAFDETLELITSQKALGTLTKYQGNEAKEMSSYFARIALHQPLVFDKALEVIGKYDYVDAKNIVYWFTDKTLNLNPDILQKALEFLESFDGKTAGRIIIYFNRVALHQPVMFKKFLKVAEKYPENCREIIIDYLSETAWLVTHETTKKILNVLQSDKIMKTLSQYQGETAKEITRHFGFMAMNFDITRYKMINLYCDLINSSSNVDFKNLERIITDDHLMGRQADNFIKKEYLKNLTKEEGSLSKKIEVIEAYKSLKELNIKVSSPSLSPKWKAKIKGYIEKAIRKVYGVKGKSDIKYLPLLSIDLSCVSEDTKGSIKSFLISIPEKEFGTGKVYEKLIVTKLKEKVEPLYATKALIYGLISRPFFQDKEGHVHARLKPLKQALNVFDKGKLRSARKHIQNLGPGKVYNLLKDDLKSLEQGDGKTLEQTITKIKKSISEKDGVRIESISDMVAQIEGIKKSPKCGVSSVIFKMQDPDITDLFDNRTTYCCAFFPDGANCEAAIGYLKDPEIGLLHAKAVMRNDSEDEEVETSGVAILVNAEDYYKGKVLLVDSVESGETISRIDKSEEFNKKYFNAIIKVAEDIGAKKIVFNANVNNSGPKCFNAFLESRGLKKETTILKKKGNVKEEFYLEAFGGWVKPKGKVKGYVLGL